LSEITGQIVKCHELTLPNEGRGGYRRKRVA
jgi:hypothetical protein